MQHECIVKQIMHWLHISIVFQKSCPCNAVTESVMIRLYLKKKNVSRRWQTYLCQMCCWYLNVTLIIQVFLLFVCACKQVWSCCRTTVMGGLLEPGLELLQLCSNQHFPKQEIWMNEIVRTRTTVWSSFTELTVKLNWKAKASRGCTCLDCDWLEAVWKYTDDKRFTK